MLLEQAPTGCSWEGSSLLPSGVSLVPLEVFLLHHPLLATQPTSGTESSLGSPSAQSRHSSGRTRAVAVCVQDQLGASLEKNLKFSILWSQAYCDVNLCTAWPQAGEVCYLLPKSQRKLFCAALFAIPALLSYLGVLSRRAGTDTTTVPAVRALTPKKKNREQGRSPDTTDGSA